MLSRRTFVVGLASAMRLGPALLLPRSAHGKDVIDATGRVLAIPAQVTRVFPAGPPAAIMLYTLAPELLIGWSRAHSPEQNAFLLPRIAARPEVGRITGRGNTANLEMVLAHKPDLILDIGSTTETYVSLAERVQVQTGIPYALLDGRLTATAEAYRRLGALIRKPDQAEALAAYAEDVLRTVTGRISDIPLDRRPRVYYARGPRGLETGLGGSINMETIELLARNVAGERKGGLATVSVEQVLAWNPDVIVTIERAFARTVATDPAWSGVAAVRTGRVHLAPMLPFGWVDFPPSVNRLMGLWWLGKILYPERFPEDIRERATQFYTRFYHVAPSREQMDAVLG